MLLLDVVIYKPRAKSSC